MQFDVRTLSPEMVIGHLVVDGRDEADARRQVEARGLYVSSIAPVRGGRRGRGKSLSLLLFSQELLALLNAGLGVVEALEALLEKEAAPATRTVLERLLAGLREGQRFSAVLADQPDLFPPLYIGIVRAAEGTSDLPRALARAIEYQQRAISNTSSASTWCAARSSAPRFIRASCCWWAAASACS
jgi:general secretion pathway protein F